MTSHKDANIAVAWVVAPVDRGPVAQWLEHPAYIRAVPGSSPGGPTILANPRPRDSKRANLNLGQKNSRRRVSGAGYLLSLCELCAEYC